jgi:hypothetical protein
MPVGDVGIGIRQQDFSVTNSEPLHARVGVVRFVAIAGAWQHLIFTTRFQARKTPIGGSCAIGPLKESRGS